MYGFAKINRLFEGIRFVFTGSEKGMLDPHFISNKMF